MKRVLLSVCGIFLVLVSTSIVSATDNIVKAQSAGGVRGAGGPTTITTCSAPLPNLFISFAASTDSSGSINDGSFGINLPTPFPGVLIWSGTINGGTFSSSTYQLTGQVRDSIVNCGTSGNMIPQRGDTITISGNCGDNVPIQYSSSNDQIRGTFTGNVQCVVPPPDTTPPVITVPSDITVQATSPTGAVVTYTASATDNVDGPVTPSCSPASGSTFPVGSTTVTCTATDTAGNTASLTFTVTVIPQPVPTPPPDSACVGTGSGNSVITGTPGPDTIIGTNGNNLMDGLAGNDAMNGCSGSDRMNGGADNDGMAGSEGNDSIHGDDGNDNIQGGNGNDNLFGDAGTNTLTGGPGRDSFFCSPNSETTITDFEPLVDRIIGPCTLVTSGSLATSTADSSTTTPSTLISIPTS